MVIYHKLLKNQSTISKSSQRLFDKICEIIGADDIYYHKINHEKGFGNKRVDFYDERTNIVIEYLGDLYHANQNRYDASDIIETQFFTKTARQIWDEEQDRKNFLEQKYNLKIYYVWESEFLKDEDLTTQLITDFILKEREKKNVARKRTNSG